MPGELEDSKDSEDAEGDKRPTEVLVVGDAQPDVVGQDGDYVDDAHDTPQVLAPVRGGVQSQEVLGREDHDTGRVQDEQLNSEAFPACRVSCGFLDRGKESARDRLDHVCRHREGYEEPRDVIKDEGCCVRVGVLKGRP